MLWMQWLIHTGLDVARTSRSNIDILWLLLAVFGNQINVVRSDSEGNQYRTPLSQCRHFPGLHSRQDELASPKTNFRNRRHGVLYVWYIWNQHLHPLRRGRKSLSPARGGADYAETSGWISFRMPKSENYILWSFGALANMLPRIGKFGNWPIEVRATKRA